MNYRSEDIMSDSVLTEVLLNLCQLTGSKYAKVLGGAACNWRTEASIGVADEQFGEDLLRNIISYGEVVVINPGTAFSYSLQFANRSHSFVCIALRVGKDELCGAIILGGSPKDLQLSSAIRYLIQIHAARASSLLHQNSGAGVEDMTTVNLDRLRLLESVVINAKDAILITETGVEEPAPKIIYCNPSFLKVTGYSLAEVIGSTPRMLQCERTDRAALNKIRIALQSWRPVEVELINCRKDGSYFWVELSIVPVADENGWYTHWVSVQRDISDRKNSEVASALAIKEREERLALESRLKEREVMTKHLSFIAFHDELTSLCNRVYMMSQLSQLFAANCSQRIKATLILIDLDGFKLINDSMGYLSGDTLLKNVASRLQSCLRGNDVLARIGGDEFSILLCGEDQRGVSIALAERIVERLQQQIKIDDQEVFISCSIGIVVANKFHNKPEDLLRDADVAMYSAKRQGPGKWCMFDVTMREDALKSFLIQSTMRQGLINKEFFICYQPIVRGSTSDCVAFEALVRWKHPQLGVLNPDLFISAAEKNGLIHELGFWVMQKACIDMSALNLIKKGHSLRVNVNVSAKELVSSGFLDQVLTIISDTGIAAKQLQLEITESVLIQHPELANSVLEKIRNNGVRVALDDFGIGYSSLDYIAKYPFDEIKIDKTFTLAAVSNKRSEVIVKSIVALSSALNLETTAEGVENNEQFSFLKGIGCTYNQGYLFSVPLPFEDLVSYLS